VFPLSQHSMVYVCSWPNSAVRASLAACRAGKSLTVVTGSCWPKAEVLRAQCNSARSAGLRYFTPGVVAAISKTSHLFRKVTTRAAEIEHLKLQTAKLRSMQFGRKSEKLDHQIEQLELQREDLQDDDTEAEREMPAADTAPRRRALTKLQFRKAWWSQ
jgi:hypothetical protein